MDGILTTLFNIPKKKASGILARTKIIARLDVAEKEYLKMEELEQDLATIIWILG